MGIYIDYREKLRHSEIVSLCTCLEINPTFISMKVGDYLYNNILVEHKTANDYVKSIYNGLLFQQIQDMQNVVGFHLYIIVSSNIREILYTNTISENELFGSIASVFVRGIPILFCGNIEHMLQLIIKLSEKHNDDRIRSVNPIRKAITNEDQILYNYSTLPKIGINTAKKLKEVFTTPKSLYNASIKQLTEIEGIGKKKATDLYKFFNGETNE